ncbi:MAG: hypothetical protein UT61_C0008G0043 [Candidatus Woesebacteria bacterium GW2011_GWA1_39_8]|uniref:Uncharacterized protein n=1 Tax=Candidatus Woesebacteria bacterium GW2011_GWA1_39_8 TaxID=1618552 RepID=A0A0G0SXQ3_9BACT|nr:MAG: hypothetical protein UT61_C0008G0043 [Candidatus Woesebacteria bacterium GW2011_GWA1_39_8]
MSEDQLDTETHKATTQTWKVAEESPVTVLETVNFPDGTSILRLPDKDGKPIYFPSYRISVERPDDLLPGKRHEVLKDIGRSDVVIRGNLSKEQLERLDYALDDLKLPTILAVHAALNTDLDLKSYQKPNKDVPIPVTLAMLGRPGVGKSFMSGLLSYREGYSIRGIENILKKMQKEKTCRLRKLGVWQTK